MRVFTKGRKIISNWKHKWQKYQVINMIHDQQYQILDHPIFFGVFFFFKCEYLHWFNHDQQDQILDHPIFIGCGADFSPVCVFNIWSCWSPLQPVRISKYLITQFSLVVALTVFSIFDPVDHYCNQIFDHQIFIGCGADDGAVPKSHAYTNTSTALINDASEWTFLRGKIYLWWCWEVSVLKWFTFCSNTTISPNIFHFLFKIASIPLCRIEMKTWWHTGNWIGTNFIRYPISDAKCPHLSNPPSRTCWCHATTQSDRIKCNRIFSRSLGYRWE